MHHPRLADYFEDFTRPHTSLYANLAAQQQQQQQQQVASGSTGPGGATVTYGATNSPSSMAPSFLPIEEIYLPPHYQPINPEDEDDVVPDQHAAFGIARAMDAVGRRAEPLWRDLGLQEVVRGERLAGGGMPGLQATTAGSAASAAVGLRVKESGTLMGGRRVMCLR
jgi:Apc13p protein